MDKDAATMIASAADDVFERVGKFLDVVNAHCDQEARRRIHLSVGKVIAEFDLAVLEPIYRQYPDLRPDGMEEVKS